MKIITVLLLSILTAGNGAVAALSVDDHVKILMRRYQQVEDQLARSIHYSRKEQSGDETTIQQAWCDGSDGLIKVATERIGPGGRELIEYFATDFEKYGPRFILTRKETSQPDGGTQVEESRQYFNEDAALIRELRKSGRFKPGESTDTVGVPSVTTNLSKQPKDSRSETERSRDQTEFFEKPVNISNSLQESGQPSDDPFANVTGDSEKYRVIQHTASPDGRYAIALGFSRGKVDWEKFADPDNPGTYWTENFDGDVTDPNSGYGKVVNYVVDLTTRRILGATGCDYFGTRQRYNHRECDVLWSPDSKNFVQIYSDKWNYESCRAGRIAAGPKLVGTVDLGKYAEKVANGFRATHKVRKERGSIAISASEVRDDGSIELELTDQESSGDRKGDVNFSADEKVRLRETRGGLQLDTVSVRKAPEE